MNKELFFSMQRQLTPSPQARAALDTRLRELQPRHRSIPRWSYGALAACLLLAIAVPTLYWQLSPTLHAVVPGQTDGLPIYQQTDGQTPGGQEDASSLPKLNFWDTDAPTEGSSACYPAGEGVNRDAVQQDLEALFEGSVPEELGWGAYSDLEGFLSFGPPKGASERTQRPLDELFQAHFYAQCSWGKVCLMVGGLGTRVSPGVIGRPEDYPGDSLTIVEGIEICAARFTDLDGTAYGEVSFTLDSGYSIFYSVNTPTTAQTEDLLSRLVQLAVVENLLSPQGLSPDTSSYSLDGNEAGSMEAGDASAPEPLAGVSSWADQPWFGGYYYDNAAGQYVIVQVEGESVPDFDFGDVSFVTGTYSYAHLSKLMDRLNELAQTDPECGAVMAVWSLNELENRIDLTITQRADHLLAILAQLDPAGDAIRVTVGSLVSTDDMEAVASYETMSLPS